MMNWKNTLRELATVVFGILIAFTLNSWAQNRNDNKVEEQYLQSLHNDLVEDSLLLTQRLAQIDSKLAFINKTIPHFYREDIPGRDTIMRKVFQSLSGFRPFVPHMATYETLKFSGDLKLIDNFELRKRVADHYNRYHVLDEEGERMDNFTTNFVSEYMMKKVKFGSQEPQDILNDWEFKNLIFAWMGIYQIQKNVHEDASERIRETITAVEAEF